MIPKDTARNSSDGAVATGAMRLAKRRFCGEKRRRWKSITINSAVSQTLFADCTDHFITTIPFQGLIRMVKLSNLVILKIYTPSLIWWRLYADSLSRCGLDGERRSLFFAVALHFYMYTYYESISHYLCSLYCVGQSSSSLSQSLNHAPTLTLWDTVWHWIGMKELHSGLRIIQMLMRLKWAFIGGVTLQTTRRIH